ncbi:hypothetical protein AWENTII_008072 [Aspergillus wentii]
MNMEDLLRLIPMDWAEEMEMEMEVEMEMEEEGSEREELPRADNFDWAEDVQEEVSESSKRIEIVDDRIIDSSSDSGSFGSAFDSDSDSDNGNLFEPSETQAMINSMQEDVRREFSFRDYCMKADEDETVHHFNWMGCPVYEYNWTPAVISLLFLMSSPKIPRLGDEYRLRSIMTRAMVWVDPVIVHLEDGWKDLHRRGLDLVRFATGRVFKFYSPHGTWVNDEREISEETALDDGDIQTYLASGMAQGNGFVKLCTIRSRDQWEETRDELMETSRAITKRVLRQKIQYDVFAPSPLRQSMAAEELEEENEAKEPISEPSRKRSIEEIACPSRVPLKRRRAIHNLRVEADLDAITMVEENDYDGDSEEDEDEEEFYEENGDSEEDGNEDYFVARFGSRPVLPTWRLQHTKHGNKGPRLQRGTRQPFKTALEPISEEEEETTTTISLESHVGTKRSASGSEEWKPKGNKAAGVKRWRRVARKARRALGFGGKGSLSSGSSVYTNDSKFSNEYIAVEEESSVVVAEEPSSPRRSFATKVSLKKESISKKIKGGMNRLSKGSGEQKEKEKEKEKGYFREMLKEGLIMGLSGMGPYPFAIF